MSHYGDESRIYVGNLPPDIRNRDIEDLFYKFGKINFIDLKNRRGPPFAFIEFDDRRDAEDAVDRRDGYDYDGYKLRVEFPRGSRRDNSSVRSFGYGYPARRTRGPPRRSGFRVYVTGLPFSGSWQDLKDHMREAGEICYADVYKDGTGIVEFTYRDDMKYAIKHLDDTKFRSHEGDSSYIRVSGDSSGYAKRGRSYSRSRSRSRSRSYSYTPRSRGGRSYSRSRSRSITPRSRSRSYSRSRSRSYTPRSRSRSYTPRSRSGSRSVSRSRSGSRSPY